MRKMTFLLIVLAFAMTAYAQNNNSSIYNDVNPLSQTLAPYADPKDDPLAIYDVLRNHNVDSLIGTVYSYGVCWTGSNYVTSRFSTQNMYNKESAAWTKLDSFSASGAGTGFFRDHAYFNGRIWGSPLSTIIYGINAVTGVMEKTITTSYASIRGCAYDPVRNGIWIGTTSFTGPLRCVDTNGVAIVGAMITTPASGLYGVAYDNDPAGPFLWVSTDQTPASPTGVALIKYNATTLVQIGTPINIAVPLTVGGPNLASGGCEVTTTLVPGKRTLVGMVQGTPDRVYVVELGNVVSGITPISNEIPSAYDMSQNYPNPFNPVTKINFAIPKSGLVTIKVYDVAGKEVASLVNEEKNAGSYSVDFTANKVSSGVYFYKITAGDFSAVKRMMLIK